jgi:tRNA-dihydrouridine synthase A
MMEYTDRHQRYLFRLLSKRAVLYTEMVTANALVHMTDPLRVLENLPFENDSTLGSGSDSDIVGPLVLQLGGSSPEMMMQAAKISKLHGYSRVNINCGCPSPRVAGSGQFGASLMQYPELVSSLCNAVNDVMGDGEQTATTVKIRIGVTTDREDADSTEENYNQLANFVDVVSSRSRTKHFVVHARKAILNTRITPADNRRIPPLRYDIVHRLCRDFPNLAFTLNGGLGSLDACLEQLGISDDACRQAAFIRSGALCPAAGEHAPPADPAPALLTPLAGVMVGRACIEKPFSWSTLDSRMYGVADPTPNRGDLLQTYAHYANLVERKHGAVVRRSVTKPLLGLFWGEAGGRAFRAQIDALIVHARTSGVGALTAGDIILRAAESSLDSHTLSISPQMWLKANEIGNAKAETEADAVSRNASGGDATARVDACDADAQAEGWRPGLEPRQASSKGGNAC